MTAQTFRWMGSRRERIALRDEMNARMREYDYVLKVAALLGNDAGAEMYYLSHEDDPIPKAPDPSMWQDWAVDKGLRERHQAMMFNAQMAFAIGRAEGFAEAFEIDVMDKVQRSLREAS